MDIPPVFVHHPGDPWETEASVHVGEVLSLRLIPAGGYRWSTVDSSDPQTAAATPATQSGPDPDGTVHTEVSALRPGAVILSATTSHTGDRFGPPTRIWRMTLHVEP